MAWFDFGKQKREEARRVDTAKERGREAAEAMGAQVDRILAERYGHVKAGFLEVLNDGLSRDIAQKDHSPMLCGRANLTVYIERVEERVGEMTSDILTIMGDWRDGFEQMGLASLVDEFVKSRVADWQVDVQTAGMQLMMDRGDELMAADTLWRIQHPDQARHEPLPQ
jgi:hypothetical protein